jgi:hypothetical protein
MEYIKVSETVTGAAMEPSRVIIWKREPVRIGWGEYVTHIEVMPAGRVPFQVMGHYDLTLTEALEDFDYRVKHQL